MQTVKSNVRVRTKADRKVKAISQPRISQRASSLASAFVHAIIPREVIAGPEQSRLYSDAKIDAGTCVYCGGTRTDWDHLFNLVKGKRPSGYYHVAANIVPACNTCNQSKSGSDWKSWMNGTAKKSLFRRKVGGIQDKIATLEKFVAASNLEPEPTESMQERVGADLWNAYWSRYETICTLLKEADEASAEIRNRLYRAAS